MAETTYRTQQQAQLAKEFIETYGLSAEQISFDGDSADPLFDFEALSTLALQLGDFKDIRLTLSEVNTDSGYISAQCTIELTAGQRRSFFGVAFLNEGLQDGSTITDQITASNVARMRALRTGLRGAGFDAVRAHQAAQAGSTAQPGRFDEQAERNTKLAEIHALATEVGWIKDKGKDKSIYRQQLQRFFGVDTAADLNEEERQIFTTTMRSLLNAKLRAAA